MIGSGAVSVGAERAPLSVNAREFREAMSRFASGVTVVTTCKHESWAADRPSAPSAPCHPIHHYDPGLFRQPFGTFKMLLDGGLFGVNFLNEGQSPIARRFAQTTSDKFEGLVWKPGRNGVR